MKHELTTNEAMDQLRADEYANWSYNGARAIVEYLEELEQDLGESIEFDTVAIRCDFSEYTDIADIINDYFIEGDIQKEFQEEGTGEFWDYIVEKMQYNTTVIAFQDGIIIQNF